MKLRLLILFCVAFTGLFAQPDTTGIKYLKYDGVRFYLGQKKTLKDVLMYDAWALDKLDINAKVADSLADFLSFRKNVVIELGGHSDCGSDADAQVKKSLNAANYVKDYLVSKGVPADHIQTAGYGQNLPIVPCTETFTPHPENRRIEARITDFVRPAFTYADSVLYSGQAMTVHSIGEYISGGSLTPEGMGIVDSLLDFMQKQPTLKVEVGVHTDTRGKADANLDKSKTYAQVLKSSLVNRGIDENRIVPVGYGKSMPVVPCPEKAECGEDIHGKNRRIEIKILSTQ